MRILLLLFASFFINGINAMQIERDKAYLLERTEAINAKSLAQNPYGITIIKALCTQKKYAPLLKEVLQKKLLDPDTSWTEGRTTADSVLYLLTTALHNEAYENAFALIEGGANPNNAGVFAAGCAGHWPPLAIAAHDGNVEMVDILLAHQADPNKSRIPNPLGCAIARCISLNSEHEKEPYYQIIQRLLDAKADHKLIIDFSMPEGEKDKNLRDMLETKMKP